MRLLAGLIALVLAAACSEDEATSRPVPLSETAEGKAAALARKAKTAKKVEEAKKALGEEPPEADQADAGADQERVLPPGMVWLPLPGLGVEVAAPAGARIDKARGGEIRLTDGASELRLRRADGRSDMAAVKARLARQADKINWIIERAEGEEFRLEYVLVERRAKAPVFGLAMRRAIAGRAIDCASRGPQPGSNTFAFEACHSMRAARR